MAPASSFSKKETVRKKNQKKRKGGTDWDAAIFFKAVL
jgi:hypothetical protein